MSKTEDAINQITLLGKKEVYLACMDEKNQESTRTILYHLKKKMLDKAEAEVIGITKYNSPDGQLFVKVYKRPALELYELNENGEMVLIKMRKEDDPELKRIIELMRKDKKTEKEIQEIIDEYDLDEEVEIDETPELVNRNTEKEEMRKLVKVKKDQ
jgi:hypothetical protein